MFNQTHASLDTYFINNVQDILFLFYKARRRATREQNKIAGIVEEQQKPHDMGKNNLKKIIGL